MENNGPKPVMDGHCFSPVGGKSGKQLKIDSFALTFPSGSQRSSILLQAFCTVFHDFHSPYDYEVFRIKGNNPFLISRAGAKPVGSEGFGYGLPIGPLRIRPPCGSLVSPDGPSVVSSPGLRR